MAKKKRGRPRRGGTGSASVEERILESACSLFYGEGLHAVGIDRVLAEAGAAKASLYQHFSSKDELVAAYLQRRTGEWQAQVNDRLAAAGARGRAGLLVLFDQLEAWAASPEFRGCPFQNAASELPDPAHPARKVARRHREWLHALVRRLVEEAGVGSVERVSRSIVLLCDGAMASAVLDSDGQAVAVARFAAERLLEA